MRTGFQRIVFLLTIMIAVVLPAGGVELTPLDNTMKSKGFEVIEVRDGVTAYKHPSSKIIRVAAEGVFNAPPKIVRDVLIDYKAQLGKVGRVSEACVMERGSSWLLVYQRLNLPVISDRDFNLYVTWGKSNHDLWVKYRAVNDRGEKKKDGIVRVTNHKGSWQLRPIEAGKKTFVRFQVSIDLSGSLPLWLARSGAGDELPQLFVEMSQIVADRI